MPALDIVDSGNKKVGTVEALASVFEGNVNEGIGSEGM